MPFERPLITDLLPTHEVLLAEHLPRVAQLIQEFDEEGVDPKGLGVIITDVRGEFGVAALDAASDTGLVAHEDGGVLVVVIGIDGLVAILDAVVPEALGPTLGREPGTMPILVVDRDDEPALQMVAIEELGL